MKRTINTSFFDEIITPERLRQIADLMDKEEITQTVIYISAGEICEYSYREETKEEERQRLIKEKSYKERNIKKLEEQKENIERSLKRLRDGT